MGKKLEFNGGWGMAFIPIGVFLFFCVMYFIVFKAFEMYALAMGAFVGLMIGAIFTKKGQYSEFWESVYTGVKESVPIVVLLFVIGMFSALIKACDVSSGFVWLADSLNVNGGLFTAFTFLAVCIISTATGSSIGSMFTCFPIFYPAGILLGANPAALAGAIVSAAIFGDNLAPISDTTIISAGSQEYSKKGGVAEVGGVVSSRLRYSLVAGAISFFLFWIIGGGGTLGSGADEILATHMNPVSLVILVPVAIMLIVAIKTRSIYIASTVGIILCTITGLAFGLITLPDIISVVDGTPAGFLTNGINAMMATVTLVMSVYGIMGVMNAAGALERITNAIAGSSLGNTVRGTEIAMMLGIVITTLFFGGVTSASMTTFGKVQNELGKKVQLHPYRRSNLLDGFANSIPTVVPFLSVFAFIGALLSQGYDIAEPLSLAQVAGYMIYSMALFATLLFSVITGWGRKFEGTNGIPVKTIKEASAKEMT